MCACVRLRVHARVCLYFFSCLCVCVCVCVCVCARARMLAWARMRSERAERAASRACSLSSRPFSASYLPVATRIKRLG